MLDQSQSAWNISVKEEPPKPLMANTVTSISSSQQGRWDELNKPKTKDQAESPIQIIEEKDPTPPRTPTPPPRIPTPEPVEEKKEPEIEVIDMDWKNSKVYKHVKEIMNLPANGKR